MNQQGTVLRRGSSWYFMFRDNVMQDGAIVRKQKVVKLADVSDRYRRESDLSLIPQETLDLWKNTGRGVDAPAGDGVDPASQARPWSLWRYALLLVLITAIIESVLASRYLSVEKEVA